MNKIINIYLIIFISLIFSEQKIVALDGDTDDRFGQSVYISDEWVFIGANRDYNDQVNSGSVYIYVINDNMTLDFHSKIYPSDYSYGQFFGKSIVYNQGWLAVSAIYDHENGIKSGAVYIYYFDGVDWIEHTKIIAYDGALYDRFGYSIDLYNNKLIVGSIFDDDKGENSGSAYFYEFNNDAWQLISKICPEFLETMDLFGSTVAMTDSYIAVSSTQDSNLFQEAGSVSIFSLNSIDLLYQQIIIPDDLQEYQNFGYKVDLSEEVLAISSIYDDDFGYNAGAVYIYNLINNIWEFNSKIHSSDSMINDNFGLSLSLNDNWLAVGSIDDDNGVNSGSLYIFENIFGSFVEKIKISPSDGQEYDEFSSSLIINNSYLVSGSKYDDDLGNDSGSAYLFKYKGCNDINACNYDIYKLLEDNSMCDYPVNGFDCNNECNGPIDLCGVCDGGGSNGDINIDNNVNVSDIILIVDFILNEYPINTCIVDINNDNYVNITDVVLIIEYILFN